MPMTRYSRLCFGLALVLVASCLESGLRAAPGFAQAESDLAPDPAAHFSVLPNGIRTVVLANREPRERASLRFLVEAGSFNETPDQQGLAHFLEHMAFKGSAHYPPGTLIERLQRLGMRFGADTNASTNFDHTVYLLELPDAKPETLAEGCRIFADYAGGLLLRPEQIESERGVILSEKRDRDSVDYRAYVADLNFELPESLIPRRFPIGLPEVVQKAQRGRFVDFYNAWYRPEKFAVIAVGDFDPAAVETLLKGTFGGLQSRAAALPEPDLGTVVSPLGLRAEFHPEPEAPAVEIDIQTVAPYRREPDTAAVRLRHLTRDLALEMINRRFQILSRAEKAPFTEAESSASEQFNFLRDADVAIVAKPQDWQAALGVGEQELRRALTHGFQPAELKEAVANVRNRLEQAAKGAATRRSNRLADELSATVVRKKVFTSPAQDLAFYGPLLDKVTEADCLEALRQTWSARGRDIFVSGNLALDDPVHAIQAAYEASQSVAVTAPARIAEQTFPYADFGAPGKVSSERQIDDLGVTEVGFANGVRLNLKHTDFAANQISVSVRIGGGRLTEPAAAKPGIGRLATATFQAAGLGRLGIDDLQRVLAGKTVGFRFAEGDDAFTFSGTTNGSDLSLELRLITAYLTDPGYRPEALWSVRKEIPQVYRMLEHTPDGVIQTKVERLLASGDPRFGMPAEADLMTRNFDELKAWLTPQFSRGPIEIALVGDLDPKAAIGAVAETLGALQQRESKPAFGQERQVAFPSHPISDRFQVQTEIPRGLVYLAWPTTDGRDVRTARRLSLLAQVFSDRLRQKVRNEMSGAYSPSAGSAASTVYTGYGSLVARVSVDPPTAEKIAGAVLAIAGSLQTGGVTDDELERAKRPALTEIRESQRTNRYWLESVLALAQEEPQRLDWARTRSADIASIAKPELDALAAAYLSPARAFKFIIEPEKPAP
jgi:zinc protease